MEDTHFRALADAVLARAGALADTASAIAALDVAAGLAELAREADYCCPVVDSSPDFTIGAGRHPVVEAFATPDDGAGFQPNDSDLGRASGSGDADASPGRLWLLTGPNMAGKSTFLRQNALIVVLAQAGIYVPAADGPASGWSTGCSAGSGPPTTWPVAVRPSWWKWWKRRRS